MENQETSVSQIRSVPFVVADWRVDPASNRITRGSETVKLEPKAMQVLAYLASRPGQVVTRQELEGEVWAGTVVGYDALSNAIIKLRKALGDKARDPRIIETISKTGYRLLAHVDAVAVSSTEYGQSERSSLQLPDKPSIAVLPFTNMSGDPEQEYFSDGITEDIITNLSKFSELFVIARQSTFSYKGKRANITEIGRELGVRYVLEGSVQNATGMFRITAQLVDATTEHHLWAERYDREFEHVFAVRDEVTQSIAAALLGPTGQLTAAEMQRATRQPVSSLKAHDCVLRGLCLFRSITKSRNAAAADWFQRAIELDPNCAPAYECMAWVHAHGVTNEWTSDRQKDLARALEWAQKALSLNDAAYCTHWILGLIYLYQREYPKCEAAYARAQKLNPNDAHLMAHWAEALDYLGRSEQAIDLMKQAMRLNPLYPEWYIWSLGQAYYSAEEYERAITWLRKIREPEIGALLLLTACHVALGRMREANVQIEHILKLEPMFRLADYAMYLRETSPDRFPERPDQIIDALRQTTLPK